MTFIENMKIFLLIQLWLIHFVMGTWFSSYCHIMGL